MDSGHDHDDEALQEESEPSSESHPVATLQPKSTTISGKAEASGRVRLAHVEDNDEDTLERFAEGQIAPDKR